MVGRDRGDLPRRLRARRRLQAVDRRVLGARDGAVVPLLPAAVGRGRGRVSPRRRPARRGGAPAPGPAARWRRRRPGTRRRCAGPARSACWTTHQAAGRPGRSGKRSWARAPGSSGSSSSSRAPPSRDVADPDVERADVDVEPRLAGHGVAQEGAPLRPPPALPGAERQLAEPDPAASSQLRGGASAHADPTLGSTTVAPVAPFSPRQTGTPHTSRTRSSVSTSAGAPSATTRPSRSATSRSQAAAARLRSWSTATTQSPPRAASRAISMAATWWARSRKAVGSSSSSTRGSCARARAKKTRRRSPPERASTRRPARWRRSQAASAPSTAPRSSRPATPSSPWCAERPIITTSRTVKGQSRRGSCGTSAQTRATRRRGAACGSKPASRTVPADGASSPATSRISVDLPAPLGPSSPTNSPSRAEKETPSTATREP